MQKRSFQPDGVTTAEDPSSLDPQEAYSLPQNVGSRRDSNGRDSSQTSQNARERHRRRRTRIRKEKTIFTSESHFQEEAQATRKKYVDAALEGDKKAVESAFSAVGLNVAYRIYRAAQQAIDAHKDKGLIIGNRLDFDKVIATTDIPGIDADVIKNFATMNEDTKHGRGEVLDSKKWNILVNDAWLLGGIHYIGQFFLASPRSRENIYRTICPDFKKKQDFRPGWTVFSRELIGLRSCGYTFQSHRTTGEIAYLSESHDPKQLFTFLQYQEKVNEYTRSDNPDSLTPDGWT